MLAALQRNGNTSRYKATLYPTDIDRFPTLEYGLTGGRKGTGLEGRTITRADLSESVFQEVGLSRNELSDLVETILAEVVEALARGELVKISSFGSFTVRDKGQRVGRNPKTGQEVPILPRRVLVFRASNVLKSLINGAPGENKG